MSCRAGSWLWARRCRGQDRERVAIEPQKNCRRAEVPRRPLQTVPNMGVLRPPPIDGAFAQFA